MGRVTAGADPLMPTFTPPIVHDVPRVLPETRGVPFLLMRHYSELPRGRTVVKVGGVYSTVDNPEQSLLDVATEVYLGGHIYTITDAVATALTAAGYGSGITPTPPDVPDVTFTWGYLSALTWGEVLEQIGTWG